MKSIIWFIPSLSVFLGILLLSTVLSFPVQVESISYLDKIEHAFAYFVLIITLLYGFHKSGRLQGNVWLLLIVSASFYGVFLEWVQYTYFPNRYFEWLDAISNVSGVLIGSLVFRLFKNG